MKIKFISHLFPSKSSPTTAPFMLERAKALSRFVDLEVFAPLSFFPFLRPKSSVADELIDGIRIIRPDYLALPSVLWGVRWLAYIHSLKKYVPLWEGDCDLLHIEWIYPDAYAVTKIAKRLGIKTVGVIHGNEAIEYFGPDKYREKHIEVLSILDRIIVVSSDLKNKVVNDYGVNPDKVSVVLNGVDSSKFLSGEKNKIRKMLNLSLNGKIGVCVARLSEEKNLNVLIESVKILGDISPEIYIVGDGPLRSMLLDMIVRLGVQQKVHLVGPVPHDTVPLWLQAADFFCLPSQREGCPVVVHEALACGIPVVATTVGAIPDLVCHEDYGYLCPSNNAEALASLLVKAAEKDWDNDKIAAYGQQFTWDRVAEQTVAIFRELINE